MFFVNSLHMSSRSWFDCVIFLKQTLFCFRATAPRNACVATHHRRAPWNSRAQLLQDTLVSGACCAATPALAQPGCAFYVSKPRACLGSPQILRPRPSQRQTLGFPLNLLHAHVGPVFKPSTFLAADFVLGAVLGVAEQTEMEARPCCFLLDGSHSPGASAVQCVPTVCRHHSWHRVYSVEQEAPSRLV